MRVQDPAQLVRMERVYLRVGEGVVALIGIVSVLDDGTRQR